MSAPIITPDAVREWRSYLIDFEEQVYPLLQPYGISFEVALMIWTLNRVRRELEMLNEDPDESEPWRHGDDADDDDDGA